MFMKKFIITEEEKKHILGLYEGIVKTESVCTPENKEKFDDLVTNVYPTQLKVAIKWWEDWLKSPITKQKFIQNNPNEKNPDNVFSTYFQKLSQIELLPYGPCSTDKTNSYGEAIAYVNIADEPKSIIHVNTKYNTLETQVIIDTFIHEIQHILYNYYPLNPLDKIDACFTPKTYFKGAIAQRIKKIFNFSNKTSNNVSNNLINKISKDIGVSAESAKKLYDSIMSTKQRSEEYVGNFNELSSRIFTIKQKLKLKPGENITKEMIIPYINSAINSENPVSYLMDAKSTSFDINYIILYWGYRGFTDLTSLLSGFNQLAFQKNNNIGIEDNMT